VAQDGNGDGDAVDASETDKYLYSADGERLVRTQGGASTLYLPGGMELTAYDDGRASTANRYYAFNGKNAVQDGDSDTTDASRASDNGPMSTPRRPARPDPSTISEGEEEGFAERLRERVYVTFAVLAVIVTLLAHAHGLTAGTAAGSLAITAVGTVAAAWLAELIAHLAAHGGFPDRDHLGTMTRTSGSALLTLATPLLALAVAGLGWWEVATALRVGVGALVVSLVLIAWLGIRRTQLPWPARILALGVLATLAAGVVALKLLAHG
jgi:hypothetical protein